MKKILLFSFAFLLSITLLSQKQSFRVSGVKKINYRETEITESENRNSMLNVKPHKTLVKSSGSVYKVLMGNSINPYTVQTSKSTCLTINTDLNLIAFTSRTNEASPIYGNNIATYFSTDGGNTFDTSLMRPWTSPNSYYARYPSGVIYNPAGNTDLSNAYISVSGPIIYPSNYCGSFCASQKFDGSNRNEQYTLYSTDLGNYGFYNKFPRYFMQSRNDKVFVLGDDNEDDGIGLTSVKGVCSIGVFQGNSFSWTRKLVSPAFAYNSAGYIDAYRDASLVMDNDGVNGYMIFVGRNINATDTLSYQPIVYKTTDSGLNWVADPFNWNEIPAIQNIVSLLLSPVNRPCFSMVLDITMDINNMVHIAAFIYGAYTDNYDSLGYFVDYQGVNGVVFDIHQTTGGWDAFAIDTIWAEPASDCPVGAFITDERFQISRSSDGSKIVYAWVDTDPVLSNTNTFPDIYLRMYNVANSLLLPKQNVSEGTDAEKDGYFMHLSDYFFDGANNICTIPISVSDITPTNTVANYYLKGIDINSVTGTMSNISGRVFLDINLDGQIDSGETGVAGHRVMLEPGPIFTFTNNDGYFNFTSDTGMVTVTYLPYPYWYPTDTGTFQFSVDSSGQYIDTLDIGIASKLNVNDVSVYITGGPTRSYFETHYWITYKNWGTVTANGTIEFQYDSLLTYIASTPLTLASHLGNTLTFAYDTLGPSVQRMLRVDFIVPGVQNLGDTLHNYAIITPLVPDTFVTNNYDTLQQVITGSYDPNDKKVSPAGYEQWGFVEHGQRLSYTIRFQNSGTDTAFTVVIRDTLDTDLDIETFVVEAYSHPVTWQLNNGNALFFTFQNIMLPDSNVNEPESHGFIRYSISPKQGLADGTTATNTSYIFFDYNPAIVTNTTLNTFMTNIPVASPIREALKTVLFPNPSSDYIYINLPEQTDKVEVYNSAGNLVQQLVPQKQVAEINVKDLPKGVYVVKIYNEMGIVTTKFIKN